MNVAITGAGNMGRGIGGNQVQIIDHDPAQARNLADELPEPEPQRGS